MNDVTDLNDAGQESQEINPRDLIKTYCHAKAVIKVDSLYVGGGSTSLQIKLAVANVERLNASSKDFYVSRRKMKRKKESIN